MLRLKEIKEKQLKSLRVLRAARQSRAACQCLTLAQSSLLGRKIQVQQLLTQHLNLMHEVHSTLLQFDM